MNANGTDSQSISRRFTRIAASTLAAVTCAWSAALTATSCASPAEPPGGPPDSAAPRLLSVTPDSGRVRAKIDEVSFAFDEVVQEAPRGAQTLAGIVLVSPMDGEPVVSWKRSRITVHPRRGWRDNTTYVVTLLPGIRDLHGNVRDSASVVVFSTGDSIPRTRIAGAIFDWTKALAAQRAYVFARPVDDTTVTYATESDSIGRFSLSFLPSGSYIVRALIDANHNRAIDGRELWDSLRVDLRDSTSVELYAFDQDTFPVRVRSVAVADSLTLRVTFDKALFPDSTYVPTIELRAADSTVIPVARVITWPALAVLRDARARAARDSVNNADTSTARRAAREQQRRDSIERAATVADSIDRDPRKRTAPPQSHRRPLVTEVAVELREPLKPNSRYFVRARARGVISPDSASERGFTTPKPPDKTPAATPVRRDTLGVPPFQSRMLR